MPERSYWRHARCDCAVATKGREHFLIYLNSLDRAAMQGLVHDTGDRVRSQLGPSQTARRFVSRRI
jgi:hypothetical protein